MMRALVVYESLFGNTRAVAEAVAEGLRTGMDVDLVDVRKAPEVLGSDVDLVVVGGPTHAFSMSRASTRADAARQGADSDAAAGIGLRDWVDRIASGTERAPVAAFDTKVRHPRLPGSAARAAQQRLRRAGFPVPARAENFYVTGTAGPLLDGEPARARAWGARLASVVAGAR